MGNHGNYLVSGYYQLMFTGENSLSPLDVIIPSPFLPFLSSSCLLVGDDPQALSPWLLITLVIVTTL